jgi:hypothetical protein
MLRCKLQNQFVLENMCTFSTCTIHRYFSQILLESKILESKILEESNVCRITIIVILLEIKIIKHLSFIHASKQSNNTKNWINHFIYKSCIPIKFYTIKKVLIWWNEKRLKNLRSSSRQQRQHFIFLCNHFFLSRYIDFHFIIKILLSPV